ncbi:hypothetical protein NDU88_005576 [Pleurodeles waltl]|uniref:Uncharacterized protein n=1 Tax=Pleurodeles waltl TaxID=8319 RepID=A0AAV7TWZ1_PLEWA|nr:hypothetical protein NDU88_005576 [Pleurodeles waltl]
MWSRAAADFQRGREAAAQIPFQGRNARVGRASTGSSWRGSGAGDPCMRRSKEKQGQEMEQELGKEQVVESKSRGSRTKVEQAMAQCNIQGGLEEELTWATPLTQSLEMSQCGQVNGEICETEDGMAPIQTKHGVVVLDDRTDSSAGLQCCFPLQGTGMQISQEGQGGPNQRGPETSREEDP